jgi:putative two-component system response regulator
MEILKDKKIIIVDDDYGIRKKLENIFNKNGAKARSFENGLLAIEELNTNPEIYDLVLLDVTMAKINGFETAKEIKNLKTNSDIPIIFITGNINSEDKTHGFDLGCVDYITKPFDNNEVMARSRLHLELSYRRKQAIEYAKDLEIKVQERTFEINQTKKALIISLSALAETRDSETGAHIYRTQEFCKTLAEELSNNIKNCGIIDQKFVELMYDCAPLHDVGKVGIPDNILLKPGKLNPEEFEIMKNHCLIGKKTLESGTNLLTDKSFLFFAAELAYSHHEKWNGSGYPLKIKREEIPLQGRIMAMADVYDALTSKRIYKEAWGHSEARDFIVSERGKQFDPDLVDAFLNVEQEFIEIRKKYY